MSRLLRQVSFMLSIAACVCLSGIGWYLTFTPGQSPWLFLTCGLVFSLAAAVLTFLWRLGSVS